MTAPHIDVMDLIEYARGNLRAEHADRVRAHCLGCEDCGGQLAAVLLLREGAETPAAAPARAPRRALWAAAAALIVAVPALWWVASGLAPDRGGAMLPAPEQVPGATVSAAGLPESLTPALRMALWRMKGRLSEGASVAAGESEAGAAFREAVATADTGDFTATAAALSGLSAEGAPRVALLRGVAELALGNLETARHALEVAVGHGTAADGSFESDYRTAQLFLAEVLHRQGRTDEAADLFRRAQITEAEGDRIATAARERLREIGQPR